MIVQFLHFLVEQVFEQTQGLKKKEGFIEWLIEGCLKQVRMIVVKAAELIRTC